MDFDIKDDIHWNQVQQGIKRNIQYPSKASQYLIEFLNQVRDCLLSQDCCKDACEVTEPEPAPEPDPVEDTTLVSFDDDEEDELRS